MLTVAFIAQCNKHCFYPVGYRLGAAILLTESKLCQNEDDLLVMR